eukprot:8478777-Pyramimonas_sp.AAC.1
MANMLTALLRRTASWARNWIPSVFIRGIARSEFDDWMEWCPNQVALVLDFRIFQGVFPVPQADRRYRYELGVCIAHISWRNT